MDFPQMCRNLSHMTPKPFRHRTKEEKSAATRARLITAARRLFDKHGYHNVSVTEIARAAGVTHGMIHVYFHSKAGLLYALIQDNNAAQIDRLSGSLQAFTTFEEKLRHIVTVFAEDDLSDPQLMAVMQAYFWQWPAETEAENRQQLRQALAPLWQALRDEPRFAHRSDTEIDDAVEAFYGIYSHGLRPAVYTGASAADCADRIVSRSMMLFAGLSQPASGVGTIAAAI
ncbi:TetR/AcrR family transcriptional regulator [Salipiger sp. PrR002]|uniref:TetR/AcrR family transcriptional regulator n=1 Tax=Salipiger sp. PrR002 TaxID=2706489 RepID=UPI0013BA8577|nr:TetR/AcrR family transcriptional regulator [Salipiger sp. PrR002]NDV99864.1 TetR/AcrR family transcriptional regulator [Salipiger sp. PrR002]NDW56343.1 TetR/AcrR family transcriptional regulator [Salipiger sp. PrR004]